MSDATRNQSQIDDTCLTDEMLEHVSGGIDSVPLPERPAIAYSQLSIRQLYSIGSWPTPELPPIPLVFRAR